MVVVLWVIAALLFLILLRIWPEMVKAVLVYSTVVAAAVLIIGGIAFGIWRYDSRTKPLEALASAFLIATIAFFVISVLFAGFRKVKEILLLRRYNSDVRSLSDEQRYEAEYIVSRRLKEQEQRAEQEKMNRVFLLAWMGVAVVAVLYAAIRLIFNF